MEEEVRTWWIIRGKEKTGPHVRSELKTMAATGALLVSDHIWKEGLKAPMPASSMSGLEFIAAPPPPPGAGAQAAAAQPAGWTVETVADRHHKPFGVPAAAPGDEQQGAGFGEDASQVPASHGVEWIAGGWRIFWQSPLLWGLAALIWSLPKYIAMYQLSHHQSDPAPLVNPGSPFAHPAFPPPDQLISPELFGAGLITLLVAGFVLAMMLGPVISAGLYALAHAIRENDSPGLGHIFHGFRQRVGALMMLGLLLLLCSLVAILLAAGGALLFGGGMGGQMGMSAGQLFAHPAMLLMVVMSVYMTHTVLSLGILLVLLFLLIGSFWFATPLVFFLDLGPITAMRASLGACFRNFMAILVYVLLLFDMYVGLGFVQAALTPDAGPDALHAVIGFVFTAFWVSLLAASSYAGFRNVFGWNQD